MIIEHLYLENWGPHEKLDQDFDAHIVGIIGSNGKGKSNLLQAISYALTGDLDKTKGTSYIRNFGSDHAADKAVVKLEFRVGDKHGSIERVIKSNGTTSRKLDWDGETFKAAAEVDRRMREILGADKAAMQNAVYIKQGDIDRLVKGTPTERFDTILKLMNLSFVDQRAEMVRKSIFTLKAGLKDYTEICDMLDKQRAQYVQQADDAAEQCKKHSKAHDIVKYLGELNDLRNKRKYIDGVINGKRAENVKWASALQESIDKDGTLDHMYKDRETYQAEYDRLCNLLETATENRHKAELREQIVSDVNVAKVELANCLTKKLSIGSEDKLSEKKQHIQQQYDTAAKYHEVCVERDLLRNNIHHINTELASINASISECDEKIGKLTEDIMSYARLQAIGNLCNGAEKCPICGGDMQHVDVSSIKAQYEQYSALLQQAQRDMDSSNTLRNSLLQQSATRYSQLENSNTRLAELNDIEAPVLESDMDTLSQMLRETDAALNSIRELDATINVLQNKIASTVIPDEVQCDTQEQISSYMDDRQRYATLLNDLEDKIKSQKSIVDYNGYINADLAKLEKNYVDIQEQLCAVAYADTAPEGIDPEGNDEYMAEQIAVYRQGELAYTEAKTALDIANQGIADTDEKIRDVQYEIEQNSKKLNLIDDLQQVMTLTSKSGVPLAYANDVFKSITPDVQNMLEMMQANFTVEPDNDRPLTYKFIRTDNASGYEMAQERLSGGQAIRLSIAILIATQQSILPEVGLLILDEPSSHIDAEGVEHMRDMFMGLDSILENTNMQLICVDHNTVLSSAFDKTIEL